MDLISQMVLLGGVSDRATLVRLRTAREVDAAVKKGDLLVDARGRYALPHAAAGIRVASSILGVLSHRSAAHFWGWAQKRPDGLPEVTVPRNRRVRRSLRSRLIPHWSDLTAEDVDERGLVTNIRRTLVDCLRNLPWDEALSIADSALRVGDVTEEELLGIALKTKGRGRARVIAVAREASAKAANALESVLRAQCKLIPGLSVLAQHPVAIATDLIVHPDVADPELKIVVEAEGFAWHSKSRDHTRDCRRYNLLVCGDWIVVRLSWYLVMREPGYVQDALRAAVTLARERRLEHANVAAAA